VIGVLGGIASGKSAVARGLAGQDGVVIDADELARAAFDSPEIRARVATTFGPEVLNPDGSVRRDVVARRVFASARERAELEAFTHPWIRDRIRAALDAARARGVARIVLDVPLLLENDSRHGLAAECDTLVFVDSDERTRDDRAVSERGWHAGEVARREAHQMPLAAKRARADHVIHNRGTKGDLDQLVRELSDEIDRS